MTSRRSGCLFPIIGLVAILGIAGGYAYKKGWHEFIVDRNLTPVKGARVIPDEALMTGFMDTSAKKWSKLEELGNLKSSESIKEIKTDIEEGFAESNINYEEDIQPWLGNMMFALLPEDESFQDGNLLVVAGIKNPIKAYKFLEKIEENEGEPLESIEHKGVEINVYQNSPNNEINVALLGNKIVFSDEIIAVKQAIDTYKGEPSLVSDAESKQVLAQKLQVKNNLGNIYIPDYNKILKVALQDAYLSEEQLKRLQSLESVSMGFGVEEKQFKVQTLAKLEPNFVLEKPQSLSNKIAGNYPDTTLAFLSGSGISQVWDTIVKFGEEDRELKQGLDGMRTSTRWVTGLDLDKDIFGWMDGEFALGILETKQASIPEMNLNLGMAIILETSDRDTAENTLNIIGSKLQEQANIASQVKTVNKQDIVQWSIPYSNIDISYSWIDNNNLLLTMGNNAFESVSDTSTSSLLKHPNFKELTKKLPNKNLSYFYLDMDKVLTTIKAIPYTEIDETSEAMIFLNSIQSIGAASTMPDSTTTKTDFVVQFK